MKKLLAFHGDVKIKEKYLTRVRAHRAEDELVKGQYWEDGKGCAVGCTIHSSDHAKYESQLGIPMTIARLEDSIFEELPNECAMTWPERFLEIIPVGADLSQVTDKFLLWLLSDKKCGVLQCAQGDGVVAIQKIMSLYERKISGEQILEQEWGDAADAAYAAAYAADAVAYSAAYAAAHAAYAVAYSDVAVAYSDACAAYAAGAAVGTAARAAYAARANRRIAQSEKLLELLANAPVGGGN